MKQKRLEIDAEILCGILKDCRIEMGYTQKSIAEYLHIDRSTYAKYETGRKPEIDVVVFLAELYGISLNEMLRDFRLDNSEYKKTVTVKTPQKGEDRLVRLTEEEQRLIDYYRNSSDKNAIMDFAHNTYFQEVVNDSEEENK